jgi:hypothetical protein
VTVRGEKEIDITFSKFLAVEEKCCMFKLKYFNVFHPQK